MNDVKIKLLLDGQAQVITGIEGVNQKLAGVGRGARVSAQASETLAAALARVGHYGLAGGALYGVAQSALSMGRALLEASASGQRLTTQLNFATGGRGAQELAFTADVAQRLGLNMKSTAQAYAGFTSAARGTALEGAGARQVFEGIAKASAVMGLSADQTSGALLAVQQMMSKGVVSAEEFRGQLGERMPIALQAGAQALGVTTAEFSKMLESGQIVAQDFLPKFSQAITEMLGDSVEQAANRLDASVARMGNAWERLKQTVGDSGVSKAVANEATGISQYLDSVSDAMKRAEKAGSGTLMQLSAGLGQIIARAPFDVLAGAASLLNGTINTLSGGAARLNTNINLLPDALKTTAQQSLALERDLQTARAEMVALQRQAETRGQSIYLKSEMHQLYLYIQKLDEAKKKQADLSGAGAGRGAVNPQTVGVRLDQQKRDAEAANALRLKLSGVPDGYLKDMNEIIRLNQAGVLTGKEYTDVLKTQQDALLKKTGATKDAAKTARDAAAEQEKQAKDAQKHWEDLGRAITANEGAHAKWLEQGDKTLDGLTAGNAALRLQNEAIGLTKEATDALTLSRQDAAIAEAELNLIDAQNIEHNEVRVQQLEREIRLLQERRALTAAGQTATAGAEAQKTARETTEKTAKDAADAWQKTADSIYEGLTDSLYRAFESGKGFFNTLWSSIKNAFKTTVLKLAVQGIMTGIGLGTASSAVNAATGSAAGSLLGSAGGSLLGGFGASMAGITATLGEFGTAALASTQSLIGLTGTFAQNAAAMNTVMGSTTASSAGMAVPYVAAALAVAAGLGLFRSTKTVASGLMGTVGETSDVSGYDLRRKSGYLFGGPDYSVRETALDAATAQSIDTAVATISASSKAYAAALGLGTDALKGFTTTLGSDLIHPDTGGIGIDFAGLNAEQITAKIQAELAKVGDAYAQRLIGTFAEVTTSTTSAVDEVTRAWDAGLADFVDTVVSRAGTVTTTTETTYTASEFARVGETAGQTLTRLATSLATVNGLWHAMGTTLLASNLAAGDAASRLADAAGGLDALKASMNGYYEAMYSEEEKKANTTRLYTEALQAVNLAVPTTIEAYRAQVAHHEAIAATEPGAAAALATLYAMAPAFASVNQAAAQASGSTQTLSDSVATYRDLAARLGDTRKELLAGDLSPLSPAQKYAQAQAEFASTSAGARAGDAAALGRMADASKTLLEASRANSASALDYAADFAAVQRALGDAATSANAKADVAQLQLTALQTQVSLLDQLNTTAQSMADALAPASAVQLNPTATITPVAALDGSHADGLAYVPWDGYRAELHQGERVLTAAENRNFGAGPAHAGLGRTDRLEQLTEQLTAQVAGLRAEARATAVHTHATNRKIDRLMPDGDALAVRITA